MNKIILILLGSFLAACQSPTGSNDCIDESKIDKNTVCYQLYKPVCGCDGKTYGNDCMAQKNGVTSWKEGECPQ